MLLGITMAMGTMGGYFGNIGLSLIIRHFGWRNGLLLTNILGLITLVLAIFIIPNTRSDLKQLTALPWRSELLELLKRKEVWVYSLTALGIYLCISVLADLWGVSLVVQALGISKVAATQVVSLIYVGLCLGSICLPFIGDRFCSRRVIIRGCVGLILFCATCLIYSPFYSKTSFGVLFFSIGFLSGAEILCFANLCDWVGKRSSGTAIGFMNCVVMLGGACVAHQVGRFLDLFWNGEFHSTGIRLYSINAYRSSLSLVVIVIFVAVFTSIFLPKQIKIESN
jgi:sugar phosphate permease